MIVIQCQGKSAQKSAIAVETGQDRNTMVLVGREKERKLHGAIAFKD